MARVRYLHPIEIEFLARRQKILENTRNNINLINKMISDAAAFARNPEEFDRIRQLMDDAVEFTLTHPDKKVDFKQRVEGNNTFEISLEKANDYISLCYKYITYGLTYEWHSSNEMGCGLEHRMNNNPPDNDFNDSREGLLVGLDSGIDNLAF